MPKLIAVEVRTLGELFANSRRFRLPWFQRAYSWQMQQVAQLIGDLIEAMARADDSAFMLGTVMLADVPGQDGLAIVDGHQRLLTLTILAAVLRDLEISGPSRDLVARFITDPETAGATLRFAPQSCIADFFAAYVQNDGATVVDIEPGDEALSDSERRVVEVREYLVSRFARGRGVKTLRRELARFLADRCQVVLHLYDSEEYAWRMLNIEESTRLKFDFGAHAKATILGVMPPGERRDASLAWEDSEDRIGTTGMGELLGHIRTLRSRKRSEKPVEYDVCKLFELDRDARVFTEAWLKPHTLGFEALRLAGRGGGPLPPEVRAPVFRMTWIEGDVWVPAALRWLEVKGVAHADTAAFFRLVDRLVWVLRLAGVDPSLQQRRILEVLADIDAGRPPEDMPSLDIEREIVGDAVDNLRAQNFCLKHHAPMVLRRTCLLLGRDPGPVDKKKVTVEHILPRNPEPERHWWRKFPTPQDIKAHVNRLGNLTFLSHADNQAAATEDWPAKRAILARSGFSLSEAAAGIDDWDRKAILARTETLIELLFADWRLAV